MNKKSKDKKLKYKNIEFSDIFKKYLDNDNKLQWKILNRDKK